MTGEAAVTASRAAAWRDHLRAGGTIAWRDFDGASAPTGDWLPGAQQLELLRRVNELGPVPTALADRILAAPLPFRGRPDLDLEGVASGAHGPETVDPADLPESELVRVAVSVLAEAAMHRRVDPPPAVRPGPLRRLSRRPVKLVGAPRTVRALRRRLVDAGAVLGDGGDVVVVGAPVDRLLVDAWWRRVVTHGAPAWPRWLREVVARDRLPGPVDLPAIADRWQERRPGRVVVATCPEAAFAVAGGRGPVDVPDLDGVDAELQRLVGRLLGVRVPPARRTRLMVAGVLPEHPGTGVEQPLALTPRAHRWAVARSDRMAQEIRRAGYPVVGDPALLGPAGQPVGRVGRLIRRGVLPRALAVLHRLGQGETGGMP